MLRQQGMTMVGHGNDDGDGAQQRTGRDNKWPQRRNELETQTRLERSVSSSYYITMLLTICTNECLGTLVLRMVVQERQTMAGVNGGSRRDATRLEPQVW